MKQVHESAADRIGSTTRLTGRIDCIRQHWSGAIGATLLALVAAGAYPKAYANDAATAGQWNIMVVPARQTAYSGVARERFNKYCASCHSKDGRAQTPIARQRQVQDLSECKLSDDEIVTQILEGTHNKSNTFRMPPFKDKLARAAVESLVPLVKAFRPASPADPGGEATSDPRLVGIINFPGRKRAVLEKVPFSGCYFVLAESESHDGITLGRIKPEKGSVQLWGGRTNPVVTLKLDGQLTQPTAVSAPGFARWIADAFNDTCHEVALEKADTDLVLFLYAQFTGRTLLRSPRLPAASFSLNATANNKAQIALSLEKALAEKGITTIPDGEQFILVVPTSEGPTVRLLSPEIKYPASDNGRPELFPGGAIINFPNTELSQVMKLYADLTGRKLDRTQHLPLLNGTVKFTTQTALSKEECIWALETLFRWHGVKVVPVGSDSFKAVLLQDVRP